MKTGRLPRPLRVRATSDAIDANRVDYSDAFAVPVGDSDGRSTEDWARASLEGAPIGLRWFIVAGWRFVLGLRIGPRQAADHVLGWQITCRLPAETVLELRSRFLKAHLVFHRDAERLVWSTFVEYDHRIAAVIWPPVSLLHRRIVPYTLRRAATRAPG